jgi:spore coat protein U-like protein
MSRNYFKVFAAAAFATLLLADAPARAAGSVNQTFNATASVAAKCVMSSIGDLAFGAYDPVVTNASTGLAGNTGFTLTCTRNASPVISLSVSNANFGQNLAGKRAMNNGSAGAGNFLSYDLFVPSGVGDSSTATPSVVYWGDNTSGTSTFSPSVPSIAAQTITIFGSVLPGQDVATGAYSDSVTATVNF